MLNKILIGVILFIIFILGFGAWDIRQSNLISISSGKAHAGIIDDITTAITGHVKDIKDRVLTDDEFVEGKVISESEFTLTKDSIHWAKGGVKIIEMNNDKYIQLNEDFEAGLAPDLYIFTSTDIIDSQSDLDKTVKSNLIKLKKGSGASIYKVSGDIKSIVIWCKAFNQWMGTAVVQN